MNKESSLTSNILCVVWALGVLGFARSEDSQTNAFAIAYIVPAAITLFNAYRAASGDDKQILAGPVTAVVLLAVFGNFSELDTPLRSDLCLLLTAVPFGTSVLGTLVPGLTRLPTLLAGTIVGWAGLLLTTAAISHHLPGSGLFIALDSLTKIDPFHLEYLRGPSNTELDDMRNHNAAFDRISLYQFGNFRINAGCGITKGTASIRKPETPNCSQNPIILRISA